VLDCGFWITQLPLLHDTPPERFVTHLWLCRSAVYSYYRFRLVTLQLICVRSPFRLPATVALLLRTTFYRTAVTLPRYRCLPFFVPALRLPLRLFVTVNDAFR